MWKIRIILTRLIYKYIIFLLHLLDITAPTPDIISLDAPVDGNRAIKMRKGPKIMNDAEYNKFTDDEEGGKGLVWNNYFQKMDDGREYRGQWTADRQHWEGIGEIKF